MASTDITWFMEVDAIKKVYAAVGDTFDGEAQGDDGEYESVDDEFLEDINED